MERHIIKETINPDRITLTLQIETTNVDDNSGANSGVNNSIKEYIKKNSNASSSVIASALSIPLRTVRRSLMMMQKNGIIRNDGNRKKVIG